MAFSIYHTVKVLYVLVHTYKLYILILHVSIALAPIILFWHEKSKSMRIWLICQIWWLLYISAIISFCDDCSFMYFKINLWVCRYMFLFETSALISWIPSYKKVLVIWAITKNNYLRLNNDNKYPQIVWWFADILLSSVIFLQF